MAWSDTDKNDIIVRKKLHIPQITVRLVKEAEAIHLTHTPNITQHLWEIIIPYSYCGAPYQLKLIQLSSDFGGSQSQQPHNYCSLIRWLSKVIHWSGPTLNPKNCD